MASMGGVYFPVRAGFCDTTVARQITRRLGDAGFHAYVRLLCLLLNEECGRLPLQLEEEWEDLADRVGLDQEGAKELVEVMRHYKAAVVEGGELWSPLVSEALETYGATKAERTERARKAANARWRKDETKADADAHA